MTPPPDEPICSHLKLSGGLLILTQNRMFLASTGGRNSHLEFGAVGAITGNLAGGMAASIVAGAASELKEMIIRRNLLKLTADDLAKKGIDFVSYDKIMRFEIDGRKIGIVFDNGCAYRHSLDPYLERGGKDNEAVNFLSTVLKEKLKFNSIAPAMLAQEFSQYLNDMGLQAEVFSFVQKEPEKGLIRIRGSNINWIMKSNNVNNDKAFYYFILEGVRCKLKFTVLSLSPEHGIEYYGDKRLSTALNQDQALKWKLQRELEQPTVNPAIIVNQNGDKISIKGKKMYSSKGERFIEIQTKAKTEGEFLPTKEFIQTLDLVAQHIRNLT